METRQGKKPCATFRPVPGSANASGSAWRGSVLARLWIAALVAIPAWAGVSAANAEQRREEAVHRPTAKASGSAAASKARKNKSARRTQAAEISAEVRKSIPVFYSEIRRPVRVKLDKEYNFMLRESRPKGFFQLAGAHDKKLCAEVLEAFNEPDTRILGVGGDENDMFSDWLSNNSRIVPFTGIKNSDIVLGTRDRRMFECAMLDIDGDGEEEHLYRNTTWFGSGIYQEVAIMDSTADTLPCSSGLPEKFVSKQQGNLFGRIPPGEWLATGSPVGSVIGDKRSEEMIASPKDRNKIIRNVGNHYSVFWNFYRFPSGVVMVSIPLSRIDAPPELMVFTPARDAVRLQCIIMPVSWSTPLRRKPMDPNKG